MDEKFQSQVTVPGALCHFMSPSPHLQLLVNLVDEVAEEVEGVLLLSDIHRLAPQLEGLPEALWSIVLQLALQQVAEDTLDLWEDAGGRGGREGMGGGREEEEEGRGGGREEGGRGGG